MGKWTPWEVDRDNEHLVIEGRDDDGAYQYIASFDSTVWSGSGDKDYARASRAVSCVNALSVLRDDVEPGEALRSMEESMLLARTKARGMAKLLTVTTGSAGEWAGLIDRLESALALFKPRGGDGQ